MRPPGPITTWALSFPTRAQLPDIQQLYDAQGHPEHPTSARDSPLPTASSWATRPRPASGVATSEPPLAAPCGQAGNYSEFGQVEPLPDWHLRQPPAPHRKQYLRDPENRVVAQFTRAYDQVYGASQRVSRLRARLGHFPRWCKSPPTRPAPRPCSPPPATASCATASATARATGIHIWHHAIPYTAPNGGPDYYAVPGHKAGSF